MSDRKNTDPAITEPEPVNPADRDDSNEVDPTARDAGKSQQSSQSGQNQDQNTQYDPTNGKRPDQRRRNDKSGQMGG
ncbi:MAG: hypothetical protein V4617_19495 [Gemmatimonadota bacterium]